MSKSLHGKIAIVTGGSRGIGAAIAVEYARRGAYAIAITYSSNKVAADRVVGEIRSLGAKALAIQADAGKIDSGKTIIDAVMSSFDVDAFDILVNNAGVAHLMPFGKSTVQDYSTNFDINFRGPVLLTQLALNYIRPGGRVIMITSKVARQPLPSPYTLYGASKAALDNFARALAVEYAAEKHITINSIMPGAVETDMVTNIVGEDEATMAYLRSLPTTEKRLGTADDVAQIAGFLAEEGSRWLNGATLSATGGELML